VVWTSASFDGSGNVTGTATIQANSVALGTDTTGNYVQSVANGSYLTGGGSASEGTALTLGVDATNANTASKVVARDGSGNFSAGTVTAALSGNASTATTLQTARTINGVSFNGAANITVADSTKLPLGGGAMTGAITTNSTFDGRNVSVDGAKLDTIATSANNYSFPYTVSASESVNTVVQRNSSGYLFANYFNASGTFNASGASSGMGMFTGTNGSDTYGRSYNATAARALLNVANGATNVTNNNQLTNGAGYTTYTANQAVNTSSSPTFANVYNNGWFYSNGNTGWYNSTWGGGIHMSDNTWVRVYNGKAFYVANQIAATGNVTAYYSDTRLKTKTRDIEGALDKVASLSGFFYVENELARELGYSNKEEQVALSAQDVQAVMPQAVSLAPVDIDTAEDGTISSKSGENYLTVDYAKLVPLLVEAIKELKAEVAELKGK